MKNLLNFIVRYHNFIIFLLLESLALFFLASNNNYHNIRIVKVINSITYRLEGKITNARTYLNLNELNAALAVENTSLKNELETLRKETGSGTFLFTDSIRMQQYTYKTARIVNNSTNNQKNYLTINKGSLNGVAVDQAVTGPSGIVGIVVGSSNNYSIVMSVLNLDFRLSSRIKRNGYYGSLTWNGDNYRFASLNDIPNHIDIVVGDTVETTGFSTIFPEAIMIGTIDEFEKTSGDFYSVKVKLSTDFKNINYVSVISNLRKREQLELENAFSE